eukprot:scaffold87523_cov18-Tisochrysis_lutea.AAC.2
MDACTVGHEACNSANLPCVHGGLPKLEAGQTLPPVNFKAGIVANSASQPQLHITFKRIQQVIIAHIQDQCHSLCFGHLEAPLLKVLPPAGNVGHSGSVY